MIPVYKPYLPDHIVKYAKEAIDAKWVSSNGMYNSLTTEKLKEIFGVKYVVLSNNGTSSLHLVSKALQYKYPDKKNIIVPNSVYVACWNAFLYDNFYKLNVVETDIDTWNFDTNKLKDGSIILCVHNLGNIINMDRLKSLYPNSIFVEDNAEGLFGKHNGKYSGTDSFCSSCSFFGNKNVTSGEGGAFMTNDEDVYQEIHKIHGQGQSSEKFIHDVLGYNYRMTNIQAALLYGQLVNLDEILEMKKNVFDYYRYKLKDIEEIKIQKEEQGTIHSNWMLGVRFVGSYMGNTDFFNKSGIDTRPMFYPMSYHRHLKKMSIKQKEAQAEVLSKEVLIFPSFPELSKRDIDYITDKIKEYIILKR